MTSHRIRAVKMPKTQPKKRTSPRGKRKINFEKIINQESLPLHKKSIYMDIKNKKQADAMEEQLKKLGAVIETFLSREVNYVISSCAPVRTHSPVRAEERSNTYDENPQSPYSNAPSPFNCGPSPTAPNEIKKAVISRGKALAQIACAKSRASSVVANAEKWGIKVVSVEAANKWLEREILKIEKECAATKDIKENSEKEKPKKTEIKRFKLLKGSYIKFEACNRMYKPIRLEMDAWPRLNLLAPPGICPYGEAKLKVQHQFGRRQNPSVSAASAATPEGGQKERTPTGIQITTPKVSQTTQELVGVPIVTTGDVKRNFQLKKRPDKQQGFCECCEVKFKDLHQHITGEEHRAFARNKTKYTSLDRLISEMPTAVAFTQMKLLQHCLQKQVKEPKTSVQGASVEVFEVAPPISPLHTDKPTSLPQQHEALSLKTPQPNQELSGELSAGSDRDPASKDESCWKEDEDAQQHNRQQAVVIRRPVASGAFTSPRRRQPTPSKVPKVQERSMVFRDSPMASLQPSPHSGSTSSPVNGETFFTKSTVSRELCTALTDRDNKHSIENMLPCKVLCKKVNDSGAKVILNEKSSSSVTGIDSAVKANDSNSNKNSSHQVLGDTEICNSSQDKTSMSGDRKIENSETSKSNCFAGKDSENKETRDVKVKKNRKQKHSRIYSEVCASLSQSVENGNEHVQSGQVKNEHRHQEVNKAEIVPSHESDQCFETHQPTVSSQSVLNADTCTPLTRKTKEKKLSTQNLKNVGSLSVSLQEESSMKEHSALGNEESQSKNTKLVGNEEIKPRSPMIKEQSTPTKVSSPKCSGTFSAEKLDSVAAVKERKSVVMLTKKESPGHIRTTRHNKEKTDISDDVNVLKDSPLRSQSTNYDSASHLQSVSNERNLQSPVKSFRKKRRDWSVEENKEEDKDEKEINNLSSVQIGHKEMVKNVRKSGDNERKGSSSETSSLKNKNSPSTEEKTSSPKQSSKHGSQDSVEYLPAVIKRRSKLRYRSRWSMLAEACGENSTEEMKSQAGDSPGPSVDPETARRSHSFTRQIDSRRFAKVSPDNIATNLKRKARHCKQFNHVGLYANSGEGNDGISQAVLDNLSSVVRPNIADRVKRRSRVFLSEQSANEGDGEESGVEEEQKRRVIKVKRRGVMRQQASKSLRQTAIEENKSSVCTVLKKSSRDGEVQPDASKDFKQNKESDSVNLKQENCTDGEQNNAGESVKPEEMETGIIVQPNIAERVKRRRSCTLFNHEGLYSNGGLGFQDFSKEKLGSSHTETMPQGLQVPDQLNPESCEKGKSNENDTSHTQDNGIQNCDDATNRQAAAVVIRRKSGLHKACDPQGEASLTQVQTDWSQRGKYEDDRDTAEKETEKIKIESKKVISEKDDLDISAGNSRHLREEHKKYQDMKEDEGAKKDSNTRGQCREGEDLFSGRIKSLRSMHIPSGSLSHFVHSPERKSKFPLKISNSPRLRLRITKTNDEYSSTLEEIRESPVETLESMNSADDSQVENDEELSLDAQNDLACRGTKARVVKKKKGIRKQSKIYLLKAPDSDSDSIDLLNSPLRRRPVNSDKEKLMHCKSDDNEKEHQDISGARGKKRTRDESHDINDNASSCTADTRKEKRRKLFDKQESEKTESKASLSPKGRSKSPAFSPPQKGVKALSTPEKRPVSTCDGLSPVFKVTRQNLKHLQANAGILDPQTSRQSENGSQELLRLQEKGMETPSRKTKQKRKDERLKQLKKKEVIAKSFQNTESPVRKRGQKHRRAPSSSPSHSSKRMKLNSSWRLVSDKSMARLLDSGQESSTPFEGFQNTTVDHLPADLSYTETSEVEIIEEDQREWILDNDTVAPPEDQLNGSSDEGEEEEEEVDNNLGDILAHIPNFSSPGKGFTDSSWGDACDSYLNTSIDRLKSPTEQQNKTATGFPSLSSPCKESPQKLQRSASQIFRGSPSDRRKARTTRQDFLSGVKPGCLQQQESAEMPSRSLKGMAMPLSAEQINSTLGSPKRRQRQSMPLSSANITNSPTTPLKRTPQKLNENNKTPKKSPHSLNRNPLSVAERNIEVAGTIERSQEGFQTPSKKDRQEAIERVDSVVSFNHMSPRKILFLSPSKKQQQ